MNWRTVIQLALVHVGVSITVVPVTSTLNRIMIADMRFSALLVSLLVAFPYLLSPFQVAMGNWADRHPIWGRRRSPWMVLGGLMASFGGYFTAHAAYLMAANFWVGLLAALAAFGLWGMGVNVASVSYLSLVSELSSGETGWRSRAVSVMWTAMILSTIVASLALARLLEPFSREALYTAFGAVWMVSSFLVLAGAGGVESAANGASPAPDRVRDSPAVAFRVLAANPSARRFFIYLLLILISIHAQDVLLEPYGAEALNLPVAATSRLTSIWGLGVFTTLVGGLPLIRRLGKKAGANIGAAVAAIAFALIIGSGLVRLPTLFMASILLLGLGGGLMTLSNLSFMLDMTTPQAAGLYMGAWGMANFAGQAVGNIASGLLRDVIYLLTGHALLGYVAVFGMEVVGLLVAVWLFQKISVAEFQRDAELRLHEIVALAGN